MKYEFTPVECTILRSALLTELSRLKRAMNAHVSGSELHSVYAKHVNECNALIAKVGV